MSKRIAVAVALALLVGGPASATPVPAPQVSKARLAARGLRGKLMSKMMALRIKRAHLAPPVERLLLRNVEQIAAEGSRYGTFALDSEFSHSVRQHFSHIEAVGQSHRREVRSMRRGVNLEGLPPRFTLTRNRIGEEQLTAKYIALTPNVTVLKVGNRPTVAIEHNKGQVLQRARMRGGVDADQWNTTALFTAQTLFKQGGLTFEQVLRKSELLAD